MIVIDPNAIHRHSAVMIVLDTALIAYRAMMHPWQFVNLALLAKSPPFSYALDLSIISCITFHKILWKVVVMKYELLRVIIEWRVSRDLIGLRCIPEVQGIPASLIGSHLNWCISLRDGI